MRVVVEAADVVIPPKLWCYRLDRRRAILGGALSNGGVVADWLRTTLQLPDGAAEQVAAFAPDTHGLTVLPFLAGQRTPDWNPRATATFLGLTLDTTYSDQARIGDHICYYSDLSKLRSHFPGWDVTRSLDDIFEEFARATHALARP